MPLLDGFGLLEYVRSVETLRLLPVVFLSASTAPAQISRAYALGANFYLAKPVQFDVLVRLVSALMGLLATGIRNPACPINRSLTAPR
jgi:CheY-like chemotaxis protein